MCIVSNQNLLFGNKGNAWKDPEFVCLPLPELDFIDHRLTRERRSKSSRRDRYYLAYSSLLHPLGLPSSRAGFSRLETSSSVCQGREDHAPT